MTTQPTDITILSPSQLIRQALLDLKQCEEDPRYTIDMSDWHRYDERKDTCNVCMAGAVIAQTLNEPATTIHEPEQYEMETRRRLRALDSFRTGQVNKALRIMGLDPISYDPMYIAPYRHDEPDKFHRDMEQVITALEEHNL